MNNTGTKQVRIMKQTELINVLAPDFFLNFNTHCILNVNNTGTKQVRIMKQTALINLLAPEFCYKF